MSMRLQALVFCLIATLCTGCSTDSIGPEPLVDTEVAQGDVEPSAVADGAMTDDASEVSPEVDAAAETDGTVVTDDAVTADVTLDDTGTPDVTSAAADAASDGLGTGPMDVRDSAARSNERPR